MREFLAGIGKGQASRERWAVFDEERVVAAESRAEPGSQAVQLYDVVLLARHFEVSRLAALYRLRNLRLIAQGELDGLLDEEQGGKGKEIERSLGLPESEAAEDDSKKQADRAAGEKDFRSRFLGLAIEAYRRRKISRGKLAELAALMGFGPAALDRVLRAVGLAEEEGESEALVPEGLK